MYWGPSKAVLASPHSSSQPTARRQFLAVFKPKEVPVAEKPPPLPDVTISPDFKLAGIFLAVGAFLDCVPWVQLTLGPVVRLASSPALSVTSPSLSCSPPSDPPFSLHQTTPLWHKVTVLGLLFLVQTFRVRFVFTEGSFELRGAGGEDTGENIVVGGANVWPYESFANWQFFPEGCVRGAECFGPIALVLL